VVCPIIAGLWDRYALLIVLFAGVVGAACVIAAGLGVLVATIGGTLWGSARRLLDLIQWGIAALQTVSQASPASAASLPPALAVLFRGLAALQVEGVLLASACTGDYAFQTEAGVMGTALGLTVLVGIVACFGDRAPTWSQALAGIALRATLLLFPTVAKDSLVLMDCVTVTLAPAGAALALMVGIALVSGVDESARGSIAVQVLASNPLYACWAPGGSHRPAGILAALVFVVVVVGLPVASLAAVWFHVRTRTASLLQLLRNRALQMMTLADASAQPS